MTNYIRACPFCGGNYVSPVKSDVGSWFYICCCSCEAEGPIKETIEEAIKAWNKRKRAKK